MDEATLFLGQFFGLYLLITGVVRIAYFHEMQEAREEFMQSKMLYYLAAHATLLLGIYLVLTHSIFVNDPLSIIVTLLSYFVFVRGVAMVVLPHSWLSRAAHFTNATPWHIASGVVFLLLGATLLTLSFVIPVYL